MGRSSRNSSGDAVIREFIGSSTVKIPHNE
jgi:hypothetical protein